MVQRSWSNGVMRKTMSIRMVAVAIPQRFFSRMFTKIKCATTAGWILLGRKDHCIHKPKTTTSCTGHQWCRVFFIGLLDALSPLLKQTQFLDRTFIFIVLCVLFYFYFFYIAHFLVGSAISPFLLFASTCTTSWLARILMASMPTNWNFICSCFQLLW